MYRPTKVLVPRIPLVNSSMGITRKIRRRFLPHLKIWNFVYVAVVVFVFWQLSSYVDLEEEEQKSPGVKLKAPKVNVLLSTEFAKHRGNTMKGFGEISSEFTIDGMRCVPFKTTHRKLKICAYDVVKDEVVSKSLIKYGIWDADQLHDLESVLNRDKELGLIDIGANLGVYTLTAASMGRKVLAVDACHSTISRLKQSVYLNRFLNRVTLVEAALSTSRGYSFMFVPSKNAARAYPQLIPKELISAADVNNHRVVKNIFADDLLKFAEMNKAVIKIDIGVKSPVILAKSRIFDIIYIPCIFMTYAYEENQRRSIQIAIEDLEIKGYVPKRSRMDLRPLEIGDFENWPSRIIWVRQPS